MAFILAKCEHENASENDRVTKLLWAVAEVALVTSRDLQTAIKYLKLSGYILRVCNLVNVS